jgi:hypothetical protein
VVSQETGVQNICFAPGRACKQGIDNGRDAAPSKQNRKVVGACGLDTVAERGRVNRLWYATNTGEDAKDPMVCSLQLRPLCGELLLLAANTAFALAGLFNPNNCNLDKPAMGIDTNPIGVDDLCET